MARGRDQDQQFFYLKKGTVLEENEFKSKTFDLFRFPQFLLFRPQAELSRPVLHEFMKLVSQESKAEKFAELKFIALDLQQKFELDHDFFHVCRGLFTFLKQAKLKFIALNCSDTTKEFLNVSGMSKFVVAISSKQLSEMQKSTAVAPKIVEGPEVFVARAWAHKVASLISMLASHTEPCTVVNDPIPADRSQFDSNEIMASGNIQLDGGHFFVSITMSAAGNLDVFKNCSTYPQSNGVVTADAWLKEFVNIALHKVLRDLSDKGHSAACQVPGSVAFTGLADSIAGQISALTLDFLGTKFVCLCAPYQATAAIQKVS